MLNAEYVLLLWATAILSVIMACVSLAIMYYDGKVWAARCAAMLLALALASVGTILSDSAQMAVTIYVSMGLVLCICLSAGLVEFARKRQKTLEAQKSAKRAEATTEQ